MSKIPEKAGGIEKAERSKMSQKQKAEMRRNCTTVYHKTNVARTSQIVSITAAPTELLHGVSKKIRKCHICAAHRNLTTTHEERQTIDKSLLSLDARDVWSTAQPSVVRDWSPFGTAAAAGRDVADETCYWRVKSFMEQTAGRCA